MSENNNYTNAASVVAQMNKDRDRDLGRGSRPKSKSRSPVEISEASGANPRMATTRTQRESLQETTAAERVLQEPNPATTKAGKIRQAMKWTEEVNKFIMRTYYTITSLESNTTAYRNQLYQQFVTQYPQYQVTEQRIADQRRTIVVKNLLSNEQLQKLREQVALELQNTQDQDMINEEPQIVVDHNIEDETQANNLNEDSKIENNTIHSEKQKIVTLFEESLIKYVGTDPKERPYLPKVPLNMKTKKVITYINTEILPQKSDESLTLEEIHTLIYCAATTTIEAMGLKVRPLTKNWSNKTKKIPEWQKRLENKIEQLRKDIGRCTQYLRGNRSNTLCKKIKRIINKTKIHSKHENYNQTIEQNVDTLKQKLSALSKRLRRYKECTSRKQQNAVFETNEKIFYRQISNTEEETENNGTPTQDDLVTYWSNLWSKPVEYNESAEWIKTEERNVEGLSQMEYASITVEDLAKAIKNTANWKTPGIDNLQNFWYKKFTSLHKQIAAQFTYIVRNPDQTSSFI